MSRNSRTAGLFVWGSLLLVGTLGAAGYRGQDQTGSDDAQAIRQEIESIYGGRASP